MGESKIPIVDFSRLNIERNDGLDTKDYEAPAKLIHNSLSKFGFVYIINHGLSKQVVEKSFEESKTFFETLSLEAKSKALPMKKPITEGYISLGIEKLDKLRQSECGKDEDEEEVIEIRESIDFLTFDGAFPDETNPNMRNLFKDLGEEMMKVLRRLFQCLAISFRLDDIDHFNKCHEYMMQPPKATCKLRSLYYPPIDQSTLDKHRKVIRCGEHADFSSLTLLIQDGLNGGLQIKTKEGSFLDVDPLPGAILVNVGDLFEIWSDGLFPAAIHRVILPKVDNTNPRQCLAFFAAPDNDCVVRPILKCDNGKEYEAVKPPEYIMKKFGLLL